MKNISFQNLCLCTILIFAFVFSWGDVSAFNREATTTSYILNPFVSADWMGESDYDGTAYGASVASAGDVNDDGYGDIIVGSPHYSNGQHFEGEPTCIWVQPAA